MHVKLLTKADSVHIGNNVFRLHYKCTVMLLVAFSIIVSLRQFAADPINCIVDKISGIDKNAMDTHCWSLSTYMLPGKLDDTFRIPVAHPGVLTATNEHWVEYPSYYQWVWFVLLFQALLFYLPHRLWKAWEGGRIKMLVKHLNDSPIDEETKRQRKEIILKHFSTSKMNNNKYYVIRFSICEILNFINVVTQMVSMNSFLGYEFTFYGTDVLAMTFDDPSWRTDPMAKILPQMIKCTLSKYGPSGRINSFDGHCRLPINSFNEKIYLFLWFWFLILAIISGLAVVYRFTLVFVPQLRFYRLLGKSPLCGERDIKRICLQYPVGDWFLLNQLGKNIDGLTFSQFVKEIALRLERSDNIVDIETIF